MQCTRRASIATGEGETNRLRFLEGNAQLVGHIKSLLLKKSSLLGLALAGGGTDLAGSGLVVLLSEV